MNSENLSKRLTSILIVLVAIALIVMAFIGVYLQKLNKLTDVTPEETYSSEIDGILEYRLSVDTTEEEKEVYLDEDGNIVGYVSDGGSTSDDDWENETGYTIETQTIKSNNDEDLTSENYQEVKSIIEKRLEEMGATEYTIRLDEETGALTIGLSQNDNTEYLYETAIAITGEFRIIDYQTGVVLIDDSHVVNASSYEYSSDGSTYSVYLQIELDDEGAEILKEISNEYIEYTDEDGESTIDYISIQLDGSGIYTTYFGEEYDSNIISIPIGTSITDDETLDAYVESTDAIATIINLGKLPITYTADATGYLIRTNVTDTTILALKILLILILVVILIVFTVKYKFKGFLAGIFNAAYIAIVILVLKYLSITISVGSMFSMALLVLINTMFMCKYLKALKDGVDSALTHTLKSYYGVIFPIIIVAFVFTVASSNAAITGIGMTLFWGLIIQFLFNLIFTQVLK